MSTRGQRIARASARAHDKLRSIFLSDVCLKLYDTPTATGATPIATYDTHWYLDKREYSEMVQGSTKRYKRLVVDDVEGCRKAKLQQATLAQIGDVVFKFNAKDSFVGSVPSYEFKVQPTGERVTA